MIDQMIVQAVGEEQLVEAAADEMLPGFIDPLLLGARVTWFVIKHNIGHAENSFLCIELSVFWVNILGKMWGIFSGILSCYHKIRYLSRLNISDTN